MQATVKRSCFHWISHRGSQATNLEEAQVSPALLSAAPTALHCPMAWCDVARGDSWPGVTHAQGCAWACWLISPWPLTGGPPAQAATREGRKANEPRQTGPAIWSIGLSWDSSVLVRKWGSGDRSWWEYIPPSWRGRLVRHADRGLLLELSSLRNLGALHGRVPHFSPDNNTSLTGHWNLSKIIVLKC